jgi:hypothetical protein
MQALLPSKFNEGPDPKKAKTVPSLRSYTTRLLLRNHRSIPSFASLPEELLQSLYGVEKGGGEGEV